jgi:hypothetical protein
MARHGRFAQETVMDDASRPQVTDGHDRCPPGAESRFWGESIRGLTVQLLIGGGLCLYFGYSLIADAPAGASREEAQRWFALDNALFLALRIVGFGFLAAGGLATAGLRLALPATILCEAVFAGLMLVMSIAWTLEARASGGWNPLVILLLVLAFLSAGSIPRVWRMYRLSGAVAAESDTAE